MNHFEVYLPFPSAAPSGVSFDNLNKFLGLAHMLGLRKTWWKTFETVGERDAWVNHLAFDCNMDISIPDELPDDVRITKIVSDTRYSDVPTGVDTATLNAGDFVAVLSGYDHSNELLDFEKVQIALVTNQAFYFYFGVASNTQSEFYTPFSTAVSKVYYKFGAVSAVATAAVAKQRAKVTSIQRMQMINARRRGINN